PALAKSDVQQDQEQQIQDVRPPPGQRWHQRSHDHNDRQSENLCHARREKRPRGRSSSTVKNSSTIAATITTTARATICDMRGAKRGRAVSVGTSAATITTTARETIFVMRGAKRGRAVG